MCARVCVCRTLLNNDSLSCLQAIEMASSIRGMFKSMLMKEQWMDESTLNSALKKVIGKYNNY